MLLLQRREGQRIRIDMPDGRFVWVTVARNSRDRLVIGVDAPEDIRILREEVIPWNQPRPEDRP